jgi:hypothetical protein
MQQCRFTEVQMQASPGGTVSSAHASDLFLDTASADPAKHLLWVALAQPGPALARRSGPGAAANYLTPASDINAPQVPISTSGYRVALSRCAGTPGTVYVAVATSWTTLALWRTTSAPAGDTVPASTAWVPLAVPPTLTQLTYNLVLQAHPTLPDLVYLGETRLWRTSSGGVTGGSANPWEQCGKVTSSSQGIHWDQHALFIDPRFGTAGTYDGIRLWAGNDGGVWRSVDGGTNFGPRNRGLQTLQFFQLVSHPTARPVILAGAQDNGVLRSDGCVRFGFEDPPAVGGGPQHAGRGGALPGPDVEVEDRRAGQALVVHLRTGIHADLVAEDPDVAADVEDGGHDRPGRRRVPARPDRRRRPGPGLAGHLPPARSVRGHSALPPPPTPRSSRPTFWGSMATALA